MSHRRGDGGANDLFVREVSIVGNMQPKKFFLSDSCKFDVMTSESCPNDYSKGINSSLFSSASWCRSDECTDRSTSDPQHRPTPEDSEEKVGERGAQGLSRSLSIDHVSIDHVCCNVNDNMNIIHFSTDLFKEALKKQK